MGATRIIGIDYGLARIGVAISDETKTIAFPAFTVLSEKRTETTVNKLAAELQRHGEAGQYVIDSVVVGLPLLMSGKHGLQADEVKHFASLLEQTMGVRVILWDERLTTVMAERSLREGRMSRKKRSKVVDKVSAALILQNHLESKIQ